MFIKKSFVDEIADSMERNLIDGAINKKAELEARLVKAADYLNSAAEIFDETGLSVQAEVITAVLESLAAKKSKKKKKVKPKSKKPTIKKKAPTSEKMVENLKEKGWVFDESDANDSNYALDHNHIDDNCAMCGDMSYAEDEDSEEELYSMLKDFKRDNDFEDEDDFEVEIHDPFKNYNKIDVEDDVSLRDPFAGFDRFRV